MKTWARIPKTWQTWLQLYSAKCGCNLKVMPAFAMLFRLCVAVQCRRYVEKTVLLASFALCKKFYWENEDGENGL